MTAVSFRGLGLGILKAPSPLSSGGPLWLRKYWTWHIQALIYHKKTYNTVYRYFNSKRRSSSTPTTFILFYCRSGFMCNKIKYKGPTSKALLLTGEGKRQGGERGAELIYAPGRRKLSRCHCWGIRFYYPYAVQSLILSLIFIRSSLLLHSYI